jgi:hypothetical protein
MFVRGKMGGLPAEGSWQSSTTQEGSDTQGALFWLIPKAQVVDHPWENACLCCAEKETQYTYTCEVLDYTNTSTESSKAKYKKSKPSGVYVNILMLERR